VAEATAGLPFLVEAWMPESIALMKLRGFVHDTGGEVLESGSGLVRVRLRDAGGANASFSWFGLGRRADGSLNLELRLHRSDPTKENKLTIQVLFKRTRQPNSATTNGGSDVRACSCNCGRI